MPSETGGWALEVNLRPKSVERLPEVDMPAGDRRPDPELLLRQVQAEEIRAEVETDR